MKEFKLEVLMNFYRILKSQIKFLLPLFAVLLLQSTSNAQFDNVWMNAGSLHNWYSSIGSEIEEGFVLRQQYGMQWPAIYRSQDMQAARGWWIGAKNFTDETGTTFPYKVVTVGPRNPQFFAAYPIKMEIISKFEPTFVTVDGIPSYSKDVTIDEIDETMKWDRMIVNTVNTQLGITMERKIFQFSQQYNDNYIVYDYTFTNTGNTDADDEIELPGNNIQGFYTFWTYRNAVNQSVRYVIGNSTGWGKNTMNDARGDGRVDADNPNNFRTQYSWHGYTTEKDVSYNNIGGPIWALNSNALTWNASDDTIGRLGATQFIGTLTLHADMSYNDQNDDQTQPSTTSYYDSDGILFLAGRDNAFNIDRMTQQYLKMAQGHIVPRHAEVITGVTSPDVVALANQTSNPFLSSGGGFSFDNAYGPYDIPFGESIRIVIVEGAAGMNRADQVKYGRQFKNGQISAADKNIQVIQKGKDSLFTTWERATANFQGNWDIPQPPLPPSTFDVSGGGDKIQLSWALRSGDPNPPEGIRIYRALGDYDKDYELIADLPASASSFEDVNVIRGFNYFYYMTSYRTNPGGVATPSGGVLESSRYYTQTYDPTNLKRLPGNSMSDIRVVPNPFVYNGIKFPGSLDEDKIAFYNVPGYCTIRIYTELGELVKVIEHTNGSGDEYWYNVTSSNQIVVSGIYIAVITNDKTGEKHISKFAVIR